MNLSEILGWPEELENIWYQASGQDCYPSEDAYKDGECVGFNKAIKYCDRDIDREALAKVIFGLKSVFKNPNHYSLKEQEKIAMDDVQTIISTMPTWLKSTKLNKCTVRR